MNQDKQLEEIISLSEELNTIQDIDILLEKILLETRTLLNSDAGSIQIKDGDELEIDVEKGTIKDLTSGKEFNFEPFPEFAIKIIKAGGLLNYIEK